MAVSLESSVERMQDWASVNWGLTLQGAVKLQVPAGAVTVGAAAASVGTMTPAIANTKVRQIHLAILLFFFIISFSLSC